MEVVFSKTPAPRSRVEIKNWNPQRDGEDAVNIARAFAFLIKHGEEISSKELADRIRSTYDEGNPKIAYYLKQLDTLVGTEVEKVSLGISADTIADFSAWHRKPENRHLRLGQAFHTYYQLEKITSHKAWCDDLYEADNCTARYMISCQLEYTT